MATMGGDKKSTGNDEYFIGMHSIMLALEPRFMFDAAVAATDAEVVDQAADAFAESCENSDGGEGDSEEMIVIPVSMGDEGAYSLDGEHGIMATAGKTNQPPLITTGDGSDDYTFTVDEDRRLSFTGDNAIIISDAENDVLTVTIEVENGIISGSRVPGVTYDGLGTGTVTLHGSASSITEALTQLGYRGNTNYNSEDPRYGDESITVTVTDQLNRVVEKTYDLYVNPVNDVPTVDAPTDENIEIEQNEVGQIPPITIHDPDYGDEITVTLETENGVLIFPDGVDYEYIAKDVANGIYTNTYIIKGSVDEVNSILADLGYSGEKNYSGTDQIHISVTDGKSDPVIVDPIDVLVTPVNQPPEVIGTPDIPSADEGGSVILDENNFNIYDPDSSDAQLVFKITENPEYGDIWYQKVLGDDTSWVKLSVGSVFTLKDVKSGRVRYTHDGSQVQPDSDPASAMDGFKFSVNDSAGGKLDNLEMTIDLNPVNQAPVVSVEEDPDVRTDDTGGTHLVVWEGEKDATIKFQVTDPDQNPENDHIVTFTGLPRDGTLWIINENGDRVEVTVGMQVPMSWIDEGRLSYTHNGDDGAAVGMPMGETRDDSFSITVSDDGGGGGDSAIKTWEGEIRIEVWPNNDDPEFEFPPQDVGIDSRNPGVIDNSHLSLTDPDSTSEDLTYTLTGLPEHGTLYIRMWDSEKGSYYYVEVAAASYDPATGKWTGGTGITQAMIDNASDPDTKEPVLVYHYAGEGPVEDLLDTINFVVRDGAITSWDNDVPLDDKSHEGGIGSYNPETGRWELEEQTLNIIVNIDPTDPGPGELDIRSPEDPNIILDGTMEAQVNEGDMVQIDRDALNAEYDGLSDLDADNIRYRINSLPEHGQLYKLNADGSYTALTPGSTFYQSDIDNGLIFYKHNGSENFTDSFNFSASDGNRDTEVSTFNINIRPVNDTPTVRPGEIEVEENNAVDENGNPDPYGKVENGNVLGPNDIGIHDVDGTGDRSDLSGYDDPNDLTFVITKLPENGRLYLYSGSGDRNDIANWIWIDTATAFADTQNPDWSGLGGYVISMQDLIDGNLMYFNDGQENIRDSFNIVVNDNMGVWNSPENGDNSVTDEHAIKIGIIPVNDPPRQDVDETLVVDEGGQSILDGNHLHFTDPDNPSDEVTYSITEKPENGVLYLFKNGRWIALGEGSTFTQKDIDDGNLKYVHDGSEWHSDSFKYDVSDGDAVVADNIFMIDINPVNQAPEVNVDGDDARYVDQEGDKDIGGWFEISDPDYDGDEKELNNEMELTITARVKDDQYYNSSDIPPDTLFGIFGWEYVDGIRIETMEDGRIVLIGTREQLQKVLETLTYRSALIDNPDQSIDLNAAVEITVTLNDMNNGGGKNAEHTVEAGLSDSATGTLFVSPVDTAPGFETGGPVQEDPLTLHVNEDGRLVVEHNGKTIMVIDKDAFDRNNNSITLKVGNGILWIDELSGLTIDGNLTGEITLTGTLADINKALESLRYVPNANWNGMDQITVHYGDNSNTGTGGPLDANGVINIHVHAVNDQPDLTVDADILSLDGDDTTTDQSLNIPGSEYSIDDLIDLDPALNQDPDSPLTDEFTLTLSLTYADDLEAFFGELKVKQNGGLQIIVEEGGAKLILIGTKDEINEALSELTMRMTDQVDENTQFNLRFELDDGRNGGLGPNEDPNGAEGIIIKDILILANNENDPAEINNTDDIELDEDTNYHFGKDGPAISIDDPDSLDFSLEIRLSVEHGTLNWSEAYLDSLGLSYDSFEYREDATGRYYILIASQDVINEALAGLVYTADTDWNGTDVMNIYVNDRGNVTPGHNTGEIDHRPVEEGGLGLVTTDSVNITINPMNDSPVAEDNHVTLPSIDEDINSADNSGSTVGDLFGDLFNDSRDTKYNEDTNPDGSEANGFIGIWIVGGLDTGDKGTWEYFDGSDWVEIKDGMFLDKDTAIRFQPSEDYNVRRGELPDLEVRLVESNERAQDATVDLKTGNTYESSDLQRDDVPRYTDVVYLSHEVTPVNDAPILNGPETSEENPITIQEDRNLVLNGGNTISVTDVDADSSESPDYEITVTLTVENGILMISSGGSMDVGYDGPGSTLTLTGTLENINKALANLVYRGNDDYYGTDKITVTVNDNGNGTEEQGTNPLTDSTVIHILVTPVNDAPEIDTSGEASVLEDGTLEFTGDNQIVISDVDIEGGDGDHKMTVTLDGIENGELHLDSKYEHLITGGSNGSGSITIEGTLDEVNEALASLRYVPNADWNGSETLTITANDNGNFGSGGPEETTFDVEITVVPINDAPTADGDTVVVDAVDEDTADSAGQTVEDLFGDIFNDSRDNVTDGSDANDLAGIVIVGNNAAENEGSWQYYDSQTGKWVDIPADVSDTNALYLDKDTPIRFLAAPNYNGTPGSLNARLVDTAEMDSNNPDLTELPQNGQSGLDVSNNGGTTRYSDDVVVITTSINAVNDAPEIETSGEASVLEDGTLEFTGDNKITISDVDLLEGDGDHEMTVTLSGVENGELSLDSKYAHLITGGTNGSDSITLTGTLDEINEALASLRYTPNTDWNGTETLTITANDNGNYGSGGPQETTFDVVITVVPVNDAPTADGDTVVVDAVDEDTTDSAGQTVEDLFTGIFNDSRDNVTDGSDANDLAGIVIVGNNATESEGSWQYYDSQTGKWVDIPADVSDTNALYLDKDTPIRFLPAPNYNGTPGSLDARLVDTAEMDSNNPDLTEIPQNGQSGLDVSNNGGTTRYSDDVVVITTSINAVNDAPEIETSGEASVLEDGTLEFTGDNKITISDVDLLEGDGDHEMTVTLSGVENGELTLDSKYAHLITGGSNGSDSITLTGTLDEINEALESLRYTPNTDWNGTETLTITANDNGNYGSGGPQETTFDVVITVIPVNDAPTAEDNIVVVEPIDEDTTDSSGQTVEDLFGGIFNDNRDEITDGSDANDLAGIVIVGHDADSAQGTWQYFDTNTSTWVDIPTNLSDTNGLFLSSDTAIRFQPAPDFNGTPGSLSARLVDNAPVDANNPDLTELPENGASGLDVTDNGGTTRYSADVVEVTTHINAVNDAPTRNGEEIIDTELTVSYDEDGNYPSWSIEDLLAGKFNDSRDYQQDKAPDGSVENDWAGVAVTDIPDETYGNYEYWDGSQWVVIDSTLVNDNTALILSKDTIIRFVPNPDAVGIPDLYASMRLIDNSDGEVTSGNTISKTILNEDYDQTGVYSDADNQVTLIINALGKNTPPYVNDLPDDLEVVERGDPVRIGEGSTVGDRELLNIPDIGWEEFSITINREGGANGEDVFTYWNGSEFIEIGAGDQLFYEGVLVGEVTKNEGGQIVLTFNENADQESISSILGNIGYAIDSHNPPESITLEYTLNDGNDDDRQGKGGPLEGYAYQVIKIIPVPEDPIAEDHLVVIDLDPNRNGDSQGNILDGAYDPDGTDVYVVDPDGLEGEYGYLTVDSDGNWTYVINPNHPDVINLLPGQELVDVIEFQVGDGNDGNPATGTLTVIIRTPFSPAILPPTDVVQPPEPDMGFEDEDTYHSLWSTDRRSSKLDHLHLADMSVDKPVVPMVRRANEVSDWEIENALSSLRGSSVNTKSLADLWSQDLLNGIELTHVSLQPVAADSYIIYRVRTDLLDNAVEGDIANVKALMPDGSPLPYWIYFDAENGTLTVTPPSGTSGEFHVLVIAEGENGDQAAEGVVFAIVASGEEKPEVVTSRMVESATERDALEMDTIRHESYWDPGSIKDYEAGLPALIGAPSLLGQLAGIGSYGMARRVRRLEKAAMSASDGKGSKKKKF